MAGDRGWMGAQWEQAVCCCAAQRSVSVGTCWGQQSCSRGSVSSSQSAALCWRARRRKFLLRSAGQCARPTRQQWRNAA
eukprot:10442685-Prorocentrum_lima.AAC.1